MGIVTPTQSQRPRRGALITTWGALALAGCVESRSGDPAPDPGLIVTADGGGTDAMTRDSGGGVDAGPGFDFGPPRDRGPRLDEGRPPDVASSPSPRVT